MNTDCLIGARWSAALSGKRVPVFDPATGEEISSVPECVERDTEQAIAAASVALKGWRSLPIEKRRDHLLNLAGTIRDRIDVFASQLTREQGKPLKEARTEIEFGISLIEWFAREGTSIHDQTVESSRPGYRSYVHYEPIGVCAAITPWNFPFAMVARKVAPALIAGCTVILKPAPETPLTALLFAQACVDSELPSGVFNCITGDAVKIGATLMKSPIVRKMSFTGSTAIGKLLIRQSADTVKKLTLELGGNAPFIVFDDADISRAVQATAWAKYRNAGQACVGVNRFLVHERAYEDFLSQFREASAKLKVGKGSKEGIDIGPLISVRAVERIGALIEDALFNGAKMALGKMPGKGTHWIEPVILTDVTSEMSIWNEEIFGPVSTIRTFRDEDEAINLANDTVHGLAAYIFSENSERCQRVIPQLQAGMVCVNDFSLAGAQIPFGGIKQSGYGKEGGREAIYEYLQGKYVTVGPAL